MEALKYNGLEYDGIVGNVRDAQKVMNESYRNLTRLICIEEDFRKWFDSYQLPLMIRWLKNPIRRIARKAYLEGHKLREIQQMQASKRRNYDISKVVSEAQMAGQSLNRNVANYGDPQNEQDFHS